MALGDLDGAAADREKVGDTPRVHVWRGDALSLRGEPEKARAEYERFLELVPEGPDARHARARVTRCRAK